jgi:hypothetical protein
VLALAPVAALALVLLAYSMGWAMAGLRNPFSPTGLVPGILYNTGQVLAVAGPVLWAAAAVLLAPTARARLLGLLAGVVLLAPWPLVIGGA